MQVLYQIFARLDNDAAGEFIKKYQPQQVENAPVFLFEDKATACEAQKTADEAGLEPQFFYIYLVQPEEIAAHVGFYFVPQTMDNIWQNGALDIGATEDFDIIEDFSTEFVFVNERMKNFLNEYCSGVKTVAIAENDGKVWYRIEEISTLPESVYIPRPIFLSPNIEPPDTFAVQSDGRDILTENNIAWIAKHGLALSNEAEVPVGKVKWRPRIIASGKLMAQIQSEQIRGVETSLAALADSVEKDCDDKKTKMNKQ